jgi:hypothetical protein
MRLLFGLLATLAMAPGCADAGVGGFDYAPQYDFSEFYAATNNKTFQVIVSGNPFPSLSPENIRNRLLPVLQVNRPRPRLTFTYTPPAERPHPWYRLVLVFDPANDLTATRVCSNQIAHKPGLAGHVDLFAVYCRNDQMMSQAVASAVGSAPEDPEIGRMFRHLFLVLFTDQPLMRRHHDNIPLIFR